ncbi:ABC transporter permease [Novosphingobium album (ex Liu et al. 2023)]|uniref:ABC transporter permease n=1 Tax=Novosphingobium album (ex Liu et al. 2023) TaxID=3031130 RepID=A0ABT5WN97_9SPHN|nr:ABC transporter permease [Novosphingobium album (ex Liu et al. 2023)]MDE8651518.1 ABC transporter permease [Novosphingobium album (ex Liu et al. 2023)]
MDLSAKIRNYIRFHNWILTVIVVVLMIAAWHLAIVAFDVQPFVLPKPADVLASVIYGAGDFLPAALSTTKSILGGFLLAVGLGVGLALVLLSSRTLERAFFPLLVGAQLVPKVALAPLLTVWLGIGRPTEIMVAFLLSFFPIVVNTMIGIKGVELGKLDVARSMGAGPMGIFIKVTLPSALPSIFAGMKVASTLAVVGAIVGEFIGARDGLGNVLLTANSNFDTATMFAAILYLTVIGMVLFFALELIEHFSIPWHHSKRGLNLTPGGA